MNAQTYPGKGLSLSQLIFALNEELKRVAFPSPFTFDSISQIDRDTSTALATIREWKNSFVPVNRIPTDILSLIPTHLPTQKDCFHAASVCRHWRGVLLKHGALWSQLFLGKGEECVSTLLGRAKGSALDIVTDGIVPVGIMKLVSPRAQQITYLEFTENYWQDIIVFSELNSGQLPLLHTLKITSDESFEPDGGYSFEIPPSFRFFKGSINLRQFDLCSWRLSSMSHFVFPSLTAFKLFPTVTDDFSASCLFDFLKASPLLQTVELNIISKIDLSNIPQGMVIVLPNVKSFSLHVVDVIVPQIYDFASYISCPCAKYTSLTHDTYDDDMSASLEVFPTPAVWNTILHQYAASPVEEVTLEVERSADKETACTLTFRSSDAIVVRLGFGIEETGTDEGNLNMSRVEMGWEIFFQALVTIQNHPLLSQVKQIYIKQRAVLFNAFKMRLVAIKFGKLVGSLERLDKLTIYGCDLRIFLANSLDNLGPNHLWKPVVFPQIKEFRILYPSKGEHEAECVVAIVELAKSQHALGIPFERVTVRTLGFQVEMVEELRRWVGAVDWGLWHREDDGDV